MDLYFFKLLVGYSFDVSTAIVQDLLPRVLVVRYSELWGMDKTPCTAVKLQGGPRLELPKRSSSVK